MIFCSHKPRKLGGFDERNNVAKRQPKEKQPETYAEWLEWEKRNWHSQGEDWVVPPNPTHLYKVGEEVILGGLKDARIEEIFDNGMSYHISYHDVQHVYGNEVDCGRKPRIVWWNQIAPKCLQENTNFARPRIHAQYVTTGMDGMILTGYRRGYIDNPEYQRGYVWNLEDKQRLIDSIFNRTDIGKFVFVEYPYPEYRLEIVDGKQRIAAIREYIEGRFPYKGKTFYQLSNADVHAFEDTNVQYVMLDSTKVSKADILWLFLSVNAAGVPQTEEHIAKAKALYEETQYEGPGRRPTPPSVSNTRPQ